MINMYKDLNDKAKEYITKQFRRNFLKKFDSKELARRCEKEIDLLYEKNLLFIIEYLYKYKKENENIKYHFRGMINNLLLLYVLDLSYVNPLEYNLPYELFNDKTINVDLINGDKLSLVSFLDKQSDNFKIISGFFIKEDLKEKNELLENHYLLIPFNFVDKDMLFKFNENSILETINDYRDYKNIYMTIRIDDKPKINSKKVIINNVLTNEFEESVSKILKPKTMDDFIKVKSIIHGVNVWYDNQDILFENKKININNLIATREDILEYLLNHSINKDKAIEITNFISYGFYKKLPEKWEEYVKLMKDNGCEDMFIDIFSKILFIFGRGQAVSECLYVLDKTNYIGE